VIVRNLEETKFIADVILGNKTEEDFYEFFEGKYSKDFDAFIHLKSIGVVNQTTMLATETQEIADLLKETMIKKYGVENINQHFADTRDTLCYATNDNQDATYGMLEVDADFAIVVGGYNSSNTTNIVKICEEEVRTYFIDSAERIISENEINHFDINRQSVVISNNYLPDKYPVEIMITSGASCPDAVVEAVIRRIVSFYENSKDVDTVVNDLLESI
jgi:4-hydroxy-3-methylbut-2-enyl diphosphate reductase